MALGERPRKARLARLRPPSFRKSQREGLEIIEKIVLEIDRAPITAPRLKPLYNRTVDTSVKGELDLIRRVAAGDQQAFLSLYDRYAPQVYSLTLHILADAMLAEEATQDTFIKFWGRARLYLPERGSFGVWLLTIARRTSLDRLRLERRRPLLSDARDPDSVWDGLADGAHDTAEARWRSLRFAVLGLPEEQRLVIDLAYYRGLSHSDIAAELGWPLGTVKTRIRAAMQALRRIWSEDDPVKSEGDKLDVD